MKFRYTVLLCLLQTSIAIGQSDSFSGASGIEFNTMNAVHAFNRIQHSADEVYAASNYTLAYRYYRLLAETGDKYSQYRLAYMYEQGQGVEKNILQSYAWSKLAAEAGQGPLIDYHQHIRDSLTEVQLSAAKSLATDHLLKYGLYAQAYNARLAIRKEQFKCTGSRVGSRCDHVTSMGYTCGITNDGLPDRTCLMLGSVGVASIIGAQPLEIRKVQLTLREVMDQFNPGTVELRELELMDDDIDALQNEEDE